MKRHQFCSQPQLFGFTLFFRTSILFLFFLCITFRYWYVAGWMVGTATTCCCSSTEVQRYNERLRFRPHGTDPFPISPHLRTRIAILRFLPAIYNIILKTGNEKI